jgi:alkylhydroperoxidase family enzyme
VPERLWEELRRHFDDRQLVELASAIAWENHRARFNRAFLVEPEGFSRGAYCPLALTPPPP